jgi:DNA-binding response OmpR family regulator
MSYNLIFIDESESMQRAVSAVFVNHPDFKLYMITEPSAIYKAAKNFNPDIIVLSYNTINTEIKKNITEIKTSREFSNIPLVLLVPSDLSDNERETLIKLKADGFIYRPFDKDAFISKIKKALNPGNAGKQEYADKTGKDTNEENVFDISKFEIKNQVYNASLTAPDFEVPEIPQTSHTPDAAYTGDITDKENMPSDPGSSELSQAFENLFKDDAIFKEFQDLNKKETTEDDSCLIDEKPTAAAEVLFKQGTVDSEYASDVNKTEEKTSGWPISDAVEEIKEFSPIPVNTETSDDEAVSIQKPEKNSEPIEFGNFMKSADHVIQEESSDNRPSGFFELNPPPDAFESAISFDSISPFATVPPEHEEDKSIETSHDISSSGGHFNGINIALDENSEEPEKKITATEIESETYMNTKKTSGEFKLKILDEQNLTRFDDYLKNAVEKTFEEIRPQIIEAIKNAIPEIIERLVKEEIEKIKHQ